MNAELNKWALESEENRRVLAQEGLILAATEEIWAAMARRATSKQQLSGLLGTGKSYVTQLLSGARNMTLRTLSDVAEVLGQRVELRLVGNEEMPTWEKGGHVLSTLPVSVAIPASTSANDEWPELDEAQA